MPPAILYHLGADPDRGSAPPSPARCAGPGRNPPHANTHARTPRPRAPGRCGAPRMLTVLRGAPHDRHTATQVRATACPACHADPIPHHQIRPPHAGR
jgi:hypothetical protein